MKFKLTLTTEDGRWIDEWQIASDLEWPDEPEAITEMNETYFHPDDLDRNTQIARRVEEAAR